MARGRARRGDHKTEIPGKPLPPPITASWSAPSRVEGTALPGHLIRHFMPLALFLLPATRCDCFMEFQHTLSTIMHNENLVAGAY